MATEQAPMNLDDSVEPTNGATAKDNDGVPYCRMHHCRMVHASSGRQGSPTSYYKCPVPKCKETGQKIKTPNEGVVPRDPMACPRCSEDKFPVYCERDQRCSTPAMVILKCPRCQWKSSGFAVPQLAAAHFARRTQPAIENIGDR